MNKPSVTVAVPVLEEEAHIEACLTSISAQTYPAVAEILVIDGGSQDRSKELARMFSGVRVIDNPRRRQASALNLALNEAKGQVFVRVDAHCVIAHDYIERCVEALTRVRPAMVGGAISPQATSGFQAAVAVAMRSPLVVGTARFHRPGARPGWVDTVYLGAFLTDTARHAGGYDEEVASNEDAEFAWRMGTNGGVWFDPSIRSEYIPRDGLASLARQFFRYGMGRANTAMRHPSSVSPRQLAAPALMIGLMSPWRGKVAAGYLVLLLAVTGSTRRAPARIARYVPLAAATIHFAWGLGFLFGLVRVLGDRVPPRVCA